MVVSTTAQISVGSVAQLFPISASEFSRYSGIKVIKPSVTVTYTIIQYIPPVLEENWVSALSNVHVCDVRTAMGVDNQPDNVWIF